MQNSIQMDKDRSYGILLPKLFLILAVIFSMWIILVLSGQMLLEYDDAWTGVTLSFWLILISVLFGAFIIIDILIYAKPTYFFTAHTPMEQTAITTPFELKHGKHVYDYTLPKDVKGGLFSKTYIPIDETTVIRVRHQIIADTKLWEKEKKVEQDKTE